MQRVVVQVPMSKELKKKAEIVSSHLGFSSLQEVIRVFLTKLSTKQLTIKVEEEEEPSKYLLDAMKQAKKNYKKGNTSPVFDNGEDAVKWLEEQGI